LRHSRARKGEATANRIRLTGLTAAFRSLCSLLPVGLAAVLVLTASPAAQDLGIRQYKPTSRLVVAQHPVPRAKYPVIDIHSHHWNLNADRWAAVVREMDTLNLRILVNLSGGTGGRLRQNLSVVANSPAPARMVQFANMDYSDINDPLFGHRVAQRLEEDAKAGARGLKIFKDFGLSLKRANGVRVPVDDPAFDEVFETCARLGLPVLIHTGEPAPFFDPVDEHNERWLELQVHPERKRPPTDYPTFEALMAERDRLFAKHPKTMFIAAHFGFHANDLDRLGRMLDRLPNVYTETGAIIEELARQPRAARAFFVKYQDRILFGKDTYEASEYPAFFRTFETADEYFDGYRDYHAFWKLYGLDLPDMVLRKLYYGNALKLVHGLPVADFPPIPAPGTAGGH